MADVPLSLAIISTLTPAVVGALPLAVGWIKDTGRDKRAAAERRKAEQDQLAEDIRVRCENLIGLARDFRVLVESAYITAEYAQDPPSERVLQAAADIAKQGDGVEFRISVAETEARSLAEAARLLAVPFADKTNWVQGAAVLPPDFSFFDQCLKDFKQTAQAVLRSQPPVRPALGGTAGPAEP